MTGWVLGLVLASYAPQQAGSALLDPPREARVQALGKQLRCPMCQGLSIADSGSSAARAQMDKVRELVAAGKTDREIRDFFTSRYGEWALLEPPASGMNLLVWLLPLLLLVGGAVAIARHHPPAGARLTGGCHGDGGPAASRRRPLPRGRARGAPSVTGSHWIPGIVVLSLGLIAGALYLFFGRRRPAAAAPADGASDAHRRVDSLLAQLREHQTEKHQMNAAAWQEENERLEHAAADAMRARDEVTGAPEKAAGKGKKGEPAATPAPSGFFGRHPQLTGAAWGAGMVIFFGALGLWLSQDQKPRGRGRDRHRHRWPRRSSRAGRRRRPGLPDRARPDPEQPRRRPRPDRRGDPRAHQPERVPAGAGAERARARRGPLPHRAPDPPRLPGGGPGTARGRDGRAGPDRGPVPRRELRAHLPGDGPHAGPAAEGGASRTSRATWR